jgi:pyruvate/2-oxoglutarate dehydrogenase complex dihydrolipoamide dehydrogenase (E3) component
VRAGQTCRAASLPTNESRVHHAAVEVLIEEKAGRLIGAHLLRSVADETINLFALAMRNGLRGSTLRERLRTSPTHVTGSPSCAGAGHGSQRACLPRRAAPAAACPARRHDTTR